MSIEVIPIPDAPTERTAFLRFTGILSLRDVAELKSSLKRLLRDGIKNLLIDLGEMLDMDEAGWAVLVSTVRKLRREKGRVVIHRCSDDLYDHLQSRHWDRDFLFPFRCTDHLESLPEDLKTLLRASGTRLACV